MKDGGWLILIDGVSSQQVWKKDAWQQCWYTQESLRGTFSPEKVYSQDKICYTEGGVEVFFSDVRLNMTRLQYACASIGTKSSFRYPSQFMSNDSVALQRHRAFLSRPFSPLLWANISVSISGCTQREERVTPGCVFVSMVRSVVLHSMEWTLDLEMESFPSRGENLPPKPRYSSRVESPPRLWGITGRIYQYMGFIRNTTTGVEKRQLRHDN